MLLVKTHLARSPIHGIGCFATESIPGGTIVWRLDDEDLILKSLPPGMERYVARFAYLNLRSLEYILCADNAKFFNHSDNPNLLECNPHTYGFDYAPFTIRAGTELTTDYRGFDANWREKLALASTGEG